jgi:hypothetical protein
MATKNNRYRIGSRLVGLAIMTFFLMSCSFQPQTNSDQHVELSENAVTNVLNGMQSDNHGLKMSCVYFAGKYKIIEVSQNLIEEIQNSNYDELCQMLAGAFMKLGMIHVAKNCKQL